MNEQLQGLRTQLHDPLLVIIRKLKHKIQISLILMK